MTEGTFKVIALATGEVRDADGNLIDTVTAEQERVVTEDDLRAMGMNPEQIAEIKKSGATS